jgi:Transposase DDE domain
MLTSSAGAEGRFDKRARDDEYRCPAGEHAIFRFATIEKGMTIRKYWPSACPGCSLQPRCTTSNYRRIARWEHEAVLDRMQRRLDRAPHTACVRRQTVEHVFGTLKPWMGSTHFLTRTLPRVRTEVSLQVLAYNMKRAMTIVGVAPLLQAMRA